MHEHINDPWVQRAKKEGYRSRASYKLMEIAKKDKLLRPGMTVVDLGAAPGGWSQVVAKEVGAAGKGAGKVIAIDLLEMDALPGVTFIQDDFTEQSGLDALKKALNGQLADLVLSDMAPNISGIPVSDQARAMHLAELALEFATDYLKPGGDFLVKVFQGAGFEEYLRALRANFTKVASRKPEASRGRSNEIYLLARGRKI